VAQSTIGRILRGEVSPQIGTMTFLTEALRIPLNALVKGAMSVDRREVDDAMFQVLGCRKDRKRAEQALESLRRREDNAIDRLQELVRIRVNHD
jgi:transcriptional regulator with XRE-family HTH domain